MKKELESITSIRDLCRLLNVDKSLIEACIRSPKYHEFTIAKKTGGIRRISSPEGMLKIVQRRLNAHLQRSYSKVYPGNVFGFIRRKRKETSNIVAHASVHHGKEFVFTIDLKDFFESISAEKVREGLKNQPFNFSHELATAITLICCYKGCLPAGAPTSPVISNFCMLGLDHKMNNLALSNGLNYSRYADDLTFSSGHLIDGTRVAEEIKEQILQYGLNINPKKIRHVRRSFRQVVTGLVVNEKPNIKRTYYKQVRAMVHDINVNGLGQACKKHFQSGKVNDDDIEKFYRMVRGRVDFIGLVKGRENSQYLDLKKKIRFV